MNLNENQRNHFLSQAGGDEARFNNVVEVLGKKKDSFRVTKDVKNEDGSKTEVLLTLPELEKKLGIQVEVKKEGETTPSTTTTTATRIAPADRIKNALKEIKDNISRLGNYGDVKKVKVELNKLVEKAEKERKKLKPGRITALEAELKELQEED